jgi:hypothetical protein
MRSLALLVLLASLTGWNTAACLAQQPIGPATLEGLLNSNEAKEPAVAAEADAGPKPPAGTVARPKDGVQHSDLDKAWAEYDVAVGKAAESIKAAINKQFDAATVKGDLDAAEKWQNALDKFEKAGEVPVETETKAAASAAVSDYKKAKEALGNAYEALVKSLTMAKKIAEATAARDEWKGLAAGVAAPPSVCVIEAKNFIRSVPNIATRVAKEWDGLTIPGRATLHWEVRLPKSGKYFVHVLYSSELDRKCNLVVDGATVVRGELGRATGGLLRPNLQWATFGPFVFKEQSLLEIVPQDVGPHYDRIVVSDKKVLPSHETELRRAFIGRWRNVDNRNLEEIADNGLFTVNGDNGNQWSGKWVLDPNDPKGCCVVRRSNNGSVSRWYVDRTRPETIVSHDGVQLVRIR